MLRRFSSQLIRLFEKWKATPDPALGLDLPMMRDMVFGGLEHIVWTARVQGREDRIDVQQLSRDLASAYLRTFGLEENREVAPRDDRRNPARGRRAGAGRSPSGRMRGD
jgi:hypothetical protein